MKINRNIIKASIALLLAVAVVVLTAMWVFPRNYSGTELDVPVGGGTMRITNQGVRDVTVSLVSPRAELFRVHSDITGVSGTSIRHGMGTDAIHNFTFDLPPGTHEFTVTNNANVTLYARSPDLLSVMVQPVSANTQRVVVALAIAFVIVAVFYASSVTHHNWLRFLGGQSAYVEPVMEQREISAEEGQGPMPHSYGDNRARVGA
mgnify:CR=1 FL=1